MLDLPIRIRVGILGFRRRKNMVSADVLVNRQSDLPHTIGTFHIASRRPCSLNRRKKQSDQNRNHDDNHQKLNKRKSAATLDSTHRFSGKKGCVKNAAKIFRTTGKIIPNQNNELNNGDKMFRIIDP